MSGEQIDPDARDYVYIQLAAILRRRIESGEYPPGRRIPSMKEAIQEFGVGDHTYHRAVAVLRDAGLIETIPHRGSFVAESAELSPLKALRGPLVRSCARLCAHAAAPPVTSPHEPS